MAEAPERPERPVREPDVERLRARYGVRLEAGEVIFREGDAGTVAFLLEEGHVRLVKTVRGAPRSLMVLKPGDLFGESAMLEGALRGSTAVALTSGLALAIDRTTLHHLVEHSPVVARRLVGQLLRRLRDAEDRIEIMMLEGNQSKVAGALLKLARRAAPRDAGPGRPEDAGPLTLTLAISPLELSTLVGLDMDTVKRAVQRMREGGYVRATDDRLEILDLPALEKLYDLLSVEREILGEP